MEPEQESVEDDGFPPRLPVVMVTLPAVEVTADFAAAVIEASNQEAGHQNFLAHFIREDIAEEKRWDASFARSEHFFERMSEEIMAEHRAGKTIEITEECLNRQQKVRKRTAHD